MKTFRIGLQVTAADAHSTGSVLKHLEELIKDGAELELIVSQAVEYDPDKEKKQ